MNQFFSPQEQASFDRRMLDNLIDNLTDNKPEGMTEEGLTEFAEKLMGEAKAAGKEAGEVAMKEEHLCLYCVCPVDDDIEHEYIKLMKHIPRKVKARLAYGFERDKDGFWMHSNVWQCILACQVAYGPLTLPEARPRDDENKTQPEVDDA